MLHQRQIRRSSVVSAFVLSDVIWGSLRCGQGEMGRNAQLLFDQESSRSDHPVCSGIFYNKDEICAILRCHPVPALVELRLGHVADRRQDPEAVEKARAVV